MRVRRVKVGAYYEGEPIAVAKKKVPLSYDTRDYNDPSLFQRNHLLIAFWKFSSFRIEQQNKNKHRTRKVCTKRKVKWNAKNLYIKNHQKLDIKQMKKVTPNSDMK